MAENPVALAEAARKVVDTLGGLSPPAFVEIGVARLILSRRRLALWCGLLAAIPFRQGARERPGEALEVRSIRRIRRFGWNPRAKEGCAHFPPSARWPRSHRAPAS